MLTKNHRIIKLFLASVSAFSIAFCTSGCEYVKTLMDEADYDEFCELGSDAS